MRCISLWVCSSDDPPWLQSASSLTDQAAAWHCLASIPVTVYEENPDCLIKVLLAMHDSMAFCRLGKETREL